MGPSDLYERLAIQNNPSTENAAPETIYLERFKSE
jgi:hypothetical protein